MEDVIIIGAGLSGLSTAYYLKQKGLNALILEARERAGGRIHTIFAPANDTPVEMGATWFANKHTHLMNLVKGLDLSIFSQYQKGTSVYESAPLDKPQLFTMPDGEAPSYRIAGGTSTIINRLAEEIGTDRILLNVQISKLCEKGNFIEVIDRDGNMYVARQVVITIPPYLLLEQTIEFNPVLPDDLIDVMQQTHTWMSDAVKFALVYEHPFWRSKGYSGTVLSQAGIATEVYDHTNVEENRFALKGFLASGAAALSKEQREILVAAQLKKLLGEEAGTYLSYTEKVWQADTFTHAPYKNIVHPHQNSGHPAYKQPLMNGKLYFAASETSPYYGGYMDGAVYSGLRAANSIIQLLYKQL